MAGSSVRVGGCEKAVYVALYMAGLWGPFRNFWRTNLDDVKGGWGVEAMVVHVGGTP